jgi:hypothetical protein
VRGVTSWGAKARARHSEILPSTEVHLPVDPEVDAVLTTCSSPVVVTRLMVRMTVVRSNMEATVVKVLSRSNANGSDGSSAVMSHLREATVYGNITPTARPLNDLQHSDRTVEVSVCRHS